MATYPFRPSVFSTDFLELPHQNLNWEIQEFICPFIGWDKTSFSSIGSALLGFSFPYYSVEDSGVAIIKIYQNLGCMI